MQVTASYGQVSHYIHKRSLSRNVKSGTGSVYHLVVEVKRSTHRWWRCVRWWCAGGGDVQVVGGVEVHKVCKWWRGA